MIASTVIDCTVIDCTVIAFQRTTLTKNLVCIHRFRFDLSARPISFRSGGSTP